MPLRAWAAGCVLAAGVGVVTVLAVGVRLTGRPRFAGWLLLPSGVLVASGCATAAAISAGRAARALRDLHRDAVL